MGDLTELIERVKAAKGPDRELDYALCDQFLEYKERRMARVKTGYDYTTSVDAALALVERVLPGWAYDLHSPRRGAPWSAVVMSTGESRKIVVGEAASACLAIAVALLAALITQDAGK